MAQRGVVCRISQWIGPLPVHCAACTANNGRGWREGETPVVSFTTRVSTSTRVRHADTGRVQTGTERERRRMRERGREGARKPTTYGHLYAGHGACQAREGAAAVTRGLNRVRVDPSFSMLDRAFSCTPLHQICPQIGSQIFSLSYQVSL